MRGFRPHVSCSSLLSTSLAGVHPPHQLISNSLTTSGNESAAGRPRPPHPLILFEFPFSRASIDPLFQRAKRGANRGWQEEDGAQMRDRCVRLRGATAFRRRASSRASPLMDGYLRHLRSDLVPVPARDNLWCANILPWLHPAAHRPAHRPSPIAHRSSRRAEG